MPAVKYLLLSALLYADGVILFTQAKQEQGEPLFTPVEKGIFTCVIVGVGLTAYGLYGFAALVRLLLMLQGPAAKM